MKEFTKEWVEFAQMDLLMAKRNIDSMELARLVSFHLQQALEKILKAYIIEKVSEELPRIHNLAGLANIAKLKLESNENDLLDELNFIYIESRYPQSQDELRDFLDKTNIKELYNKVERLVEWIKTKL